MSNPIQRETIIGDCRDVLPTLPERHFHTCVTSPPYFGLRDYGIDRQIGLEPTPDEYVAEMVKVFRLVRRVLRDDGTVWLNLGDSYNGYMANQRGTGLETKRQESRKYIEPGAGLRFAGLKQKDLIGIPWRVAFALQADGWYLRQDIIWQKPNPMPESVTDRCTKAHEYIFLLSKKPRYYYDAKAIAEPLAEASVSRLAQDVESQQGSDRVPGKTNGPMKAVGSGTRNRRSVWTVTTAPFSQAHFATFPPKLIEPCILAGCPAQCCSACGAPWERQTENAVVSGRHDKGHDDDLAVELRRNDTGVHSGRVGSSHRKTLGFTPTCDCDAPTIPGRVLDPFAGAGTTGLVADRLQRNATLIELNPEYAAMADDRLDDDAPLVSLMGQPAPPVQLDMLEGAE